MPPFGGLVLVLCLDELHIVHRDESTNLKDRGKGLLRSKNVRNLVALEFKITVTRDEEGETLRECVSADRAFTKNRIADVHYLNVRVEIIECHGQTRLKSLGTGLVRWAISLTRYKDTAFFLNPKVFPNFFHFFATFFTI